jgi:hypothetical protein
MFQAEEWTTNQNELMVQLSQWANHLLGQKEEQLPYILMS